MDDPFAVLGLARLYRVDRGAVQRAYLARAAGVHPDVARGGGSEVEEGVEANAAALNRAKETIDDPEKRAVALLGLLARDANVRFEAADERALPPGFLMEMMDVRERMEADRGDTAKMAEWERWAEGRRAGHEANAARLFDAAVVKPDAETLKAIRLELNAWRYVERMVEQMDELGSD